MANEKNLIPFTSEQSREEAKKNGQKGGIASGQARRRKKTMRELIEQVMPMAVDDKRLHAKLEKMGLDPSHEIAIIVAAIKRAECGDIEAARFIRDTKGEKPCDALNLGVFDGRDVRSLDLNQLSDDELIAILEESDDSSGEES